MVYAWCRHVVPLLDFSFFLDLTVAATDSLSNLTELLKFEESSSISIWRVRVNFRRLSYELPSTKPFFERLGSGGKSLWIMSRNWRCTGPTSWKYLFKARPSSTCMSFAKFEKILPNIGLYVYMANQTGNYISGEIQKLAVLIFSLYDNC